MARPNKALDIALGVPLAILLWSIIGVTAWYGLKFIFFLLF